MKATGIVRRFDDLGRIVIPKEIRNTLNIHENDPMEIFVDNEHHGIYLCKYQCEETAVTLLKQVAQMLDDSNHDEYRDLVNYIAEKLSE